MDKSKHSQNNITTVTFKDKLQNGQFSVKIDTFLVHLVIFVVQFYTLVWDVLFIHDGTTTDPLVSVITYRGFAGKFKHLTFWCQILQTVYFGIALLNDIVGSNVGPWQSAAARSKLQKLRDYFLAAIAFPLGSFVVVTFWGLYAVDRELVFPKALDGIIPPWLNHVMHTTVLPFLLLEKYYVYHHYPSRKKGLTGTIGFAVLYQVWILWIAYHADFWVYPVLQVLAWPGRLAFFAVLWCFMFVLYLSGEWFTKTVWSTTVSLKTDKIK